MLKTVIKSGFGEVVEKKSKFLGELHHISSAEEAKDLVAAAKKKYYDARHHCYAYLMGDDGEIKKYGDDGEPQGTAGLPMLAVLEGSGLTDCLVIVTRYFGGTLLGTGGLVRAYSAAAEAAIAEAAFAVKIPALRLSVKTEYKNEGAVRRILENTAERGVSIELAGVDYAEGCDITVNVEAAEAEALEKNLTEALSGQVVTEKKGEFFMMKEV